DGERERLDGMLGAALAVDVDREPLHGEQGALRVRVVAHARPPATARRRRTRTIAPRGSNASRTASENRLAASTSASTKMKAASTATAERIAASTGTGMKRRAASRFHKTMGSRDISVRAMSIIEPKEFMLGSTPTPR